MRTYRGKPFRGIRVPFLTSTSILGSVSVFIFLLTFCAAAFALQNPKEAWKETKLDTRAFDHFMTYYQDCDRSVEAMVYCIFIYNGLGQLTKPVQQLLPKDIKTLEPELSFQIVETIGDFILVQMEEAENPSEEQVKPKQYAEKIHHRSEMFRNAARSLIAEEPRIYLVGKIKTLMESLPADVIPQYAIGAAINKGLVVVDAHASLVPRSVLKERTKSDQSLSGIGVSFSTKDGTVKVHEVFADSPAAAAGLRKGDIIVSADGEGLGGKTSDEVRERILGPVGTKVNLRVSRHGVIMDLEVSRAVVRIPNVKVTAVSQLGNTYAHIKLAHFGEGTSEQIAAAVREVEAWSAVQGIILDFRGNPGGLLDEAVDVGGVFVGKKIIVEARAEDWYIRELERAYRSQGMTPLFIPRSERLKSSVDQLTRLPMVVLIDAGSASASELVAGALSDHERAWTVGVKSFGKGTVQKYRVLEMHPDLKFEDDQVVFGQTIARFYYPVTGRTHQGVGFDPDFLAATAPNPTPEDLAALHEGDLFPSAFPPTTTEQAPLRPEARAAIQACLDSGRRAEAKYEELKVIDEEPDFALLRAQEVLNCDHGPRYANAASSVGAGSGSSLSP
ncbi:MAG: S41 family peptidase [Bdellovibrionales bacterium]